MEASIHGIKCDAPNCGWNDMSVQWDDIKATTAEWLNKPCPKCGANLLTEEDVESTRKMLFVLEAMEEISKEIDMGGEETTAKMTSDGTGTKKITTENGIQMDLPPEMINQIYEALQMPGGKEILKNVLITLKN